MDVEGTGVARTASPPGRIGLGGLMAPWVWAFMESAAGATEIFDLRERFDQMFAV